jgi:hypothetical protein
MTLVSWGLTRELELKKLEQKKNQVFGDNPWLWFLPVGKTVGDGVHWETNENLQNQNEP